MIKIEVADYCQDCMSFEADVSKPVRAYADDDEVGVLGDTVVRCAYRRRCAAIERYLEQQMKKEGLE